MLNPWRDDVRQQLLQKWQVTSNIYDDVIAFFEKAFEHTLCYDRAWFGIHPGRISLVVGGIFLAAIIHSGSEKGIWLLVDQDPPQLDGLDYRIVKSTQHSISPLIWAHTNSYDILRSMVASYELWDSYSSASEKVLSVSTASIDRDEVQKRRKKVRLSEIWPSNSNTLPNDEQYSTEGKLAGISKHPGSLQLKPGCPIKPASTIAITEQKELEISLRHNQLQMELYRCLASQYGEENVFVEVPSGIGTSIDIVVRTDSGLVFYEIKTALSPRTCLRDAIGQLLEYAFWPGTQSAERLIVVGESPLDKEGIEYLRRLNMYFRLPIYYEHIDFMVK